MCFRENVEVGYIILQSLSTFVVGFKGVLEAQFGNEYNFYLSKPTKFPSKAWPPLKYWQFYYVVAP